MDIIVNTSYSAPIWFQWVVALLFFILFISLERLFFKTKNNKKYVLVDTPYKETDKIINKSIKGLFTIFLIALSILCSYIFSHSLFIDFYNIQDKVVPGENNNATISAQDYIHSLGFDYQGYCFNTADTEDVSILCGGNSLKEVQLSNNQGDKITIDFTSSYNYDEKSYIIQVEQK